MYLHCKVFLPPVEDGGAEVEVECYEHVIGDSVAGYVDMDNQPIVVPPGCSIEYLSRAAIEDPWAPAPEGE